MRCGSKEALRRVVESGAVVMREHRGHAMFFFPSVKIGSLEKSDVTSSAERNKVLDDDGFAKAVDMLESEPWMAMSSGSKSILSIEDSLNM